MDRETFERLRREYEAVGLDPTQVDPDPVEQFRAWFHQAAKDVDQEPNTMVLATADAEGRPSARAVLLKEFGDRGLVFYTNSRSRKAVELEANARAAVCFVWPHQHRQVRIEGNVERVSDEEADAYFATRPRGAQIGAMISPQSQVIPDRAFLEERFVEALKGDVRRPDTWGGYRLVPDAVEFWQGQPDRLHDRLRYRLEPEGWKVERLAP